MNIVTTPAPIRRFFTTTRRPTATTSRMPTHIVSNRISARSNFYLTQTFSLLTKIVVFRTECNDYEEFAYNKTYIMPPFGPVIVGRITTCAATSVGLVWGGKEVKRREFPHMVGGEI